MIPETNVRDFYAILYDYFVYVGYETTVLFVSALDHIFCKVDIS